MVPKLGNIFESHAQLKFCVTNYAVSHGYRIYFENVIVKEIQLDVAKERRRVNAFSYFMLRGCTQKYIFGSKL